LLTDFRAQFPLRKAVQAAEGKDLRGKEKEKEKEKERFNFLT
jgi:hypothetical protein